MNRFNLDQGSYVIIDIVGSTATYIAEVISEIPLMLKVEENGPYAHLKQGDFIIHDKETKKFQKDYKKFLKEAQNNNRTIISGLKSIGIKNGQLHEVLPPGN